MGMCRSGALSVRRKTASAPIPLFLANKNLKPFTEKHLGSVHFGMVPYRTEKGSPAQGIPAELLPNVCEDWTDANTDLAQDPLVVILARQIGVTPPGNIMPGDVPNN